MARIELLKVFLSDPIIQEKYKISPDQVQRLIISNAHGNDMTALCQQLLTVADNSDLTTSAAAANLNNFLTGRLKSKK